MRPSPRASLADRRLLAGMSRMVAVAAAALAGLALAAPARALLSVNVSDTASGAICSATDSLIPGIVSLPSSCTNKNPNFTTITGTIVATPPFGMSANQLSFTTSNFAVPFPDTLMINVVQSGLSFAGAATVSLAVNTLTGSNGSPSGSTAKLTAQADTTQVSQTFTATSLPITTPITLGTVTGDTAIFALTATGPNQTQSTSIAIAAVVAPATPEPGSLMLLGSALAGFGVAGVGRRRARQRRRGAAAMSRPLPVRPVKL